MSTATHGTGVRAVLRTPGAAVLIMASLVAAVPAAAIGVLVVLHVRALGESYALAGVTAGAFMFGAAASAPAVGRLVDRYGQTLVLSACTVITAAAYVGLALTPESAPSAVPVLVALVAGLCTPPVGACARTLLPDVIDDEDTLHAAYALESSALEVSYIGGLLFVALLTSISTRLALVVDAAVLSIGIAWFVVQPASRNWRPVSDDTARRALGALASPRVVVLLLTVTGVAVSFGALEVAVNAFASERGHRDATGLLVAGWGLGSLVGGVLAATASAPRRRARRLGWLLVALGAGDAALLALSGTWALAAALPLAGLAIAPMYAVLHAMTGVAASTGTSTEAFAWLGTGTSLGFSLGAALCGPAADAGGASGAFLVPLGAVAVALLVYVAGWRRFGTATVAEGEPAADPTPVR